MLDFFYIFLGLGCISILVIWKRIRRFSDHRRIHKYIHAIGGEVHNITELAFRQHIYSVQYYSGEQLQSKTVKFDIINDEIWY